MESQNLSQMIQENQPQVFEQSALDLPEEENVQTIVEEVTQPEKISIAPLNLWFEDNSKVFDNISEVKVAIRGVDPSKTLIVAVLDNQGEVDGYPSRELQLFKNADGQPVLNLPAIDMQIYNNGFRLLQPYGETIMIKAYGVRTGLICVFCNLVGDHIIPYNVIKVKKKDQEIEVPRKDPSEVVVKLAHACDLEALQLLYKQSSKYISELGTSNQSVVNWLLSRQDEITDINHHLQIDNVIIDLLT